MGFWVVGLLGCGLCSAEIDSTLRPRREEISRLAAGHTMLKKFQFLFELPSRLRQCIEMGAVSQVGHQYLCPHNEPPSPPSFPFHVVVLLPHILHAAFLFLSSQCP